jgi:hypothetical protein
MPASGHKDRLESLGLDAQTLHHGLSWLDSHRGRRGDQHRDRAERAIVACLRDDPEWIERAWPEMQRAGELLLESAGHSARGSKAHHAEGEAAARRTIGNPGPKDENLWERAKSIVKPRWSSYDEPWAVVTRVYQHLGGR